MVEHEGQGEQHGLEQCVVVGFLDFLLADQEAEVDVAERGDERKNGHVGNQVGGQLRIEQPDGETHDHRDECRPYRGGHEYLLERMARGEVDDARATDDVGEDKDEGNGGQEKRLRTFARIAHRLGDDNGDGEVEDCRQYLGAKGI